MSYKNSVFNITRQALEGIEKVNAEIKQLDADRTLLSDIAYNNRLNELHDKKDSIIRNTDSEARRLLSE